MRGLKTLVAVMTLLIVIAMGLVVYGFWRAADDGVATAPLVLPAGAAVAHMAPYNGGLALHVTAAEGEFLYFYDPRSGKPPHRVEIKREQ